MSANKPQWSRAEIETSIGSLDGFKIYHNQILLGIFMKGERSAGGIIIPDMVRNEDKWQGKVGLVLMKGPLAFVDSASDHFGGQNVEIGDWIVYRVSDGFPIDINGVHCRIMEDTHIKAAVPSPEMIF